MYYGSLMLFEALGGVIVSDTTTSAFYDALAEDYHMIFADWGQSVARQGAVLDALIKRYLPDAKTVLDCACGIGTQALGLAQRGYTVHGTDISVVEIERAKREAQQMGLALTFEIADMCTLAQQIDGEFDVVLSFDNAVPHLLTDEALQQAANAFYAVTKPGGIFTASTRDYDALLEQHPTFDPLRARDANSRVSFQLWDWDADLYTVTQFILVRDDDDWQMRHYTTQYRALRRQTFSEALDRAGFKDIIWLMPDESGYWQPVVIARR